MAGWLLQGLFGFVLERNLSYRNHHCLVEGLFWCLYTYIHMYSTGMLYTLGNIVIRDSLFSRLLPLPFNSILHSYNLWTWHLKRTFIVPFSMASE